MRVNFNNPVVRYIQQNLIAIDQLGNTLIAGWADETISARCYRNKNASRFWDGFRASVDKVCLAVFGQTAHCEKAYYAERERSQFPPELR